MWQSIKNIYHLTRAFIAALYFRFPSKRMTVIGVTGTDGKTTTVSMIHCALKALGQKAAMVTTVEAQIDGASVDTGLHVTTPDPWQVQKLLRGAVKEGVKYFVLEATSHGLDQNRLAYVDFHVGLLTNITHEHLDYHKTIEKYTASKSKLFKGVKYSIINMDDESFKYLKSNAGGIVLGYSLNDDTADFNAKQILLNLKIKGHYNLQNALASYAALRTLGFKKASIIKSLNNFDGVIGRFEEIDMGQDFTAVVDFAHTPNALKNVLTSLRSELKSEKNQLIALFGAAGRRDQSKRSLMGEVASKLADITVLTSEDPRDDDPTKIASDIAQGLKKHGKKEDKDFFIITDRGKAIQFAISLAKEGDVVGFFGKGHEKSMNVGNKELPWNEIRMVENAIRRKNKK